MGGGKVVPSSDLVLKFSFKPEDPNDEERKKKAAAPFGVWTKESIAKVNAAQRVFQMGLLPRVDHKGDPAPATVKKLRNPAVTRLR